MGLACLCRNLKHSCFRFLLGNSFYFEFIIVPVKVFGLELCHRTVFSREFRNDMSEPVWTVGLSWLWVLQYVRVIVLNG